MKTLAPEVSITDSALAQIVLRAVEGVEGARARGTRRKIEIALDDGHARVQLELAVVYGKVVPEVARAVQREVADALSTMCGVVVDAVDVSVEELDA